MPQSNNVRIVSTFLPADDAPVAYQQQILTYWRSKCAGRWAPMWRDISLVDLPPEAIPLIAVTDIKEHPLTSSYRFWGTKLTEVFGGDYTGKSPADVPPKSVGVSAAGGCGTLVKEHAPHLEVKEFVATYGLFGRAIILRLPCSNDGVTVTNGINCYYLERSLGPGPLSDFFDEILSKV